MFYGPDGFEENVHFNSDHWANPRVSVAVVKVFDH